MQHPVFSLPSPAFLLYLVLCLFVQKLAIKGKELDIKIWILQKISSDNQVNKETQSAKLNEFQDQFNELMANAEEVLNKNLQQHLIESMNNIESSGKLKELLKDYDINDLIEVSVTRKRRRRKRSNLPNFIDEAELETPSYLRKAAD